MENNCFVKKLKGVANNQDMPYFNSIKITIIKSNETPSADALSFRLIGKAKIFTDDNHVFYVDGSGTGVHSYDMDSDSYVSFKAQNDDYNIIITPKDDITTFQSDNTQKNYVFDVNDMNEVKNLLRIANIRTLIGQQLKAAAASSIACDYTGVIVDFDNFVFNDTINYWHSIYTFSYSDTKGDFSANDSFISACSKPGAPSITISFRDTKVTGDIDTFAAAIVAKGTKPNSTTIQIDVAGTTITKPAGTGDTVTITFNSSLPNGYSVA